MNKKNSIEISKEEIIGKIIKGFFMFLIIFFVIVFFNRCGSVVYADELSNYPYGKSELSFEDLSSRFINGEDDSDGVEYYYEEPQTFFRLTSTEEDERKYFDEYPYWFFYKDMVYASDYPFHYDEKTGRIETPVEKYGLNFEFYSYRFGMFKTGSVFTVSIPSRERHLVKSNYEIVDFPIDDYIVSGKDFERNIYSNNSVVLNLGYYTFSSYRSEYSFLFTYFGTGNFQINSRNSDGKQAPVYYYSYLGSDLLSYEGNKPFGYITDKDLWRFYVSSNKDIPYDGVEGSFDSGYLSIMNPDFMPDGWTPIFDDFVPISSDPGEDGEQEEEGSILDYINPFSDKFFLKIAFVPSDDFFPNQIERVVSSNEDLLHSFDNIISSLETIFSTEFGTEKFEGIDYGDRVLTFGFREISVQGVGSDPPPSCKNPVKIPGGGPLVQRYECSVFRFNLSNFKLLDASYIAPFISRFRYYINGVMDLFFMLWLVRWLLSLFGYHAPKGGYSPGLPTVKSEGPFKGH